MSWLARDLRVGFRTLRAHPGHTAASLIALGLGIGLTTATFSIVDGLLLRGLPFPEGERLMLLGSDDPPGALKLELGATTPPCADGAATRLRRGGQLRSRHHACQLLFR